MKITFIVPVYNVEKYLRQCLDSLVGQSYDNIEIIIVNDGSTDSSLQIANEYSLQDSRIKLINQENKGLSEARNTGVAHASGDYILYVDSDDYVSLDTAQIIISTCQKYPDLDIIMFSRAFFSKDFYYEVLLSDSLEQVFTGIDFLEYYVKIGSFTPSVCQRAFSRKFLQNNKITFISKILYEDMPYSILAYVKAKKVMAISPVLYFYRKDNVTSITKGVYAKDVDVLITLDYVNDILSQAGKKHILEMKEWQSYMFSWIAYPTFFKYSDKYFFSKIGWQNCRKIKHHPVFKQYLECTARHCNRKQIRIAARLINYNLILFYVLRKLLKIARIK